MRAVPVSEVFRPLVEGVGVASVADVPVADFQCPALVGGGCVLIARLVIAKGAAAVLVSGQPILEVAGPYLPAPGPALPGGTNGYAFPATRLVAGGTGLEASFIPMETAGGKARVISPDDLPAGSVATYYIPMSWELAG